jgi:CheY-like chemotaxis protein
MLVNSLLLVEDNEDDEYLALRVLRKAGIVNISVVRDGREAFELLMDSSLPLPDILLLDLRLPGFDGLKILEGLRHNERTRMLPAVILTSSEDPGDHETCGRIGVLEVIRKPLALSDFRRVIAGLANNG